MFRLSTAFLFFLAFVSVNILLVSCESTFSGSSKESVYSSIYEDVMTSDPRVYHAISNSEEEELSELSYPSYKRKLSGKDFIISCENLKSELEIKKDWTTQQNPDYLSALWYLNSVTEAEKWQSLAYPIEPNSGIHLDLVIHFQNREVSTKNQLNAFLDDLIMFETEVGNVIDLLEEQRTNGIVAPQLILERIRLQCDSVLKLPAKENPVYTSFKTKLSQLNLLEPTKKTAYLALCELRITESVIPAYARLSKYLSQLEGAAVSIAGVWQFENGTNYFANQLRWYSGYNGSVDSIYQQTKHKIRLLSESVIADSASIRIKTQSERIHFPNSAPLFRKILPNNAHVLGMQLIEDLNANGIYSKRNLEASALLVVDIGIHQKRWLSNQALEYLTDTAKMSKKKADSVVTICIGNPGILSQEKLGQVQLESLIIQIMKNEQISSDSAAKRINQHGPLPIAVLSELYLN